MEVDQKVMSDYESQEEPSTLAVAWDYIRYLYSAVIVVFGLVVIGQGIVDKQVAIYDVFGEDLPPWLAFLITILLISWLAFLEGSQAGIVGMLGVDKRQYETTHPLTHKVTSLCHSETGLDGFPKENINAFIVGRQFLVIFVVFIISQTLTFKTDQDLPFNLPSWFGEAFLESGLLGAVITIVFGQLMSQLVASKCNVDYLNSYVCYVTAVVALSIEYSGLMHIVYVLGWLSTKLAGGANDESSDQKPLLDHAGDPSSASKHGETTLSKAWYNLRCLISAFLLSFALAVVIDSLFEERTNLWDSVPPAAGFVIFLLLLFMAGTLEGFQIALFACQKMDPDTFRDSHPRAYQNLTQLSGEKLNAFLIGRQVLITLLVFILSQVTTISALEEGEDTVFGLPVGLQEGLLETGLLGALITTILGSLTARVIATAFPLGFCNAPGMGLVVHVCLFFEWIGVTNVAWPLSTVYQKGTGMKTDDNYLTY
jgi:hypothetical protein